MFKFIHAADIHLDSPLKGLESYEGAPAEQIRAAARGALVNLVDLAIEEEVAFVLIAGDLYDGNWKDYQTGFFFVSQAARLRTANIPLYVISGNHDAANKMTRSLPFPDNVKLFATKAPETVTIDDLDVAIHGQGFATAAVTEDLSQSYPAAIEGCFNIGMLHTCGSGGSRANLGHERYAPCTLDGLRLKGYDYWALGHIHQRQILSTDPLIAFSGNIQGRHARETGAKGCLLVAVDENRSVSVEFKSLDVMRWEVATVDLSSAKVIGDSLDLVRQSLTVLHQSAEGRALAVRIELTGRSQLHRTLLGDKLRWTNEIRSVAIDAGGGDIWIEKVKILTSPPKQASEQLAIPDGALGELQDLFADIQQSPDQLQNSTFDLSDVLRKLPAEMSSLVNADDPDWLRSVLAESEALLFETLLKPSAE